MFPIGKIPIRWDVTIPQCQDLSGMAKFNILQMGQKFQIAVLVDHKIPKVKAFIRKN